MYLTRATKLGSFRNSFVEKKERGPLAMDAILFLLHCLRQHRRHEEDNEARGSNGWGEGDAVELEARFEGKVKRVFSVSHHKKRGTILSFNLKKKTLLNVVVYRGEAKVMLKNERVHV